MSMMVENVKNDVNVILGNIRTESGVVGWTFVLLRVYLDSSLQTNNLHRKPLKTPKKYTLPIFFWIRCMGHEYEQAAHELWSSAGSTAI